MGIVSKILGTTKSTGGAKGGKGVTPKPKKVKKPNIVSHQQPKPKKD